MAKVKINWPPMSIKAEGEDEHKKLLSCVWVFVDK